MSSCTKAKATVFTLIVAECIQISRDSAGVGVTKGSQSHGWCGWLCTFLPKMGCGYVMTLCHRFHIDFQGIPNTE